ncbi:unnamed protein product, partial [Rotaria socialis]
MASPGVTGPVESVAISISRSGTGSIAAFLYGAPGSYELDQNTSLYGAIPIVSANILETPIFHWGTRSS